MKFTYDRNFEKFLIQQLQKEGKLNSPKDNCLLQEISTDPQGNFLNKHIETIQKSWNEMEPNFLEKLGSFLGTKNLNTDKLEVRLVRISVFPYQYEKTDEPWFAAPLFTYPSDRNRVIMHELIHYFQPTKTDRAFKEALPVILNSGDFGICNFDKGHDEPEEQKLRQMIFDRYAKGEEYNHII